MIIKGLRLLARIVIFITLVAVMIFGYIAIGVTFSGAMTPRVKLSCGTWSAEELESIVSEYLKRRLSQQPNHPIAAPYFKEHLFHRDQFKYQEFHGGLWGVPFTLQDPDSGRVAEYTAIVDCQKGVEMSVSYKFGTRDVPIERTEH